MKIKKAIKYFIIDIVIAYIIVGTLIFFFHNYFIYYPDDQDFDSCFGFKNSEKIYINGTRLYYKHNSNKLLVFYHGNAGSTCDRYLLKDEFEKYNYSYVFVEYSGYSNDTKRPNKELLLKDVIHTNNFIKNLNYTEIVLIGESIGTSMVSYHSTLINIDKIILISTYTSIADVAEQRYFFYPMDLLILKNNYNNVEWLKNYNKKILFIHGANDKMISPKLAKNLFDLIKTEDKEFAIIENAHHNNLYSFDETWDKIENFLKN